jgi:hypothetical protein
MACAMQHIPSEPARKPSLFRRGVAVSNRPTKWRDDDGGKSVDNRKAPLDFTMTHDEQTYGRAYESKKKASRACKATFPDEGESAKPPS